MSYSCYLGNHAPRDCLWHFLDVILLLDASLFERMEGKLKTLVWMKRQWAKVYIALCRKRKGESFMGKKVAINEECWEFCFGKARGDVWVWERS